MVKGLDYALLQKVQSENVVKEHEQGGPTNPNTNIFVSRNIFCFYIFIYLKSVYRHWVNGVILIKDKKIVKNIILFLLI